MREAPDAMSAPRHTTAVGIWGPASFVLYVEALRTYML